MVAVVGLKNPFETWVFGGSHSPRYHRRCCVTTIERTKKIGQGT